MQRDAVKKKSIAFVLTFLVILLFSSTVFSKDRWISVRSEHFTLIGNVNEGTLQKIGYKLEQFRGSFAMLFPASRLDDFTPIKVFVFDSHKSFKPFKPIYNGKVRENIAGYFLTDETANYIAFTSDNSGLNTYELIFHEYVHFFVEKNFANAPVWFNEGLAEVYSSFETSGDGNKLRVGLPLNRHLLNLKGKEIFPLQVLFKVDHSSPYFNENNKNSYFYSNSWALVHYLLFGNEGKRRAQLQTFLENLNPDTYIETTFKNAFNVGFEQMEKELEEYVNQSLFPTVAAQSTQTRNTAKNLRVVSVSDSELEVLLGDLQAYVDRVDEAEDRFQKVIKLNPNFSDGYLYLAKLRFYEEKPVKAKPLIEKAVSLNPQSWLAQYYYGNLLRETGNTEGALKAYRESIKQMYGFSPSHTALGFLLSDMEKLDEAIKEFETAIKLEPFNAQNYRNISHTYLRARQGKLAAENAKKFLQMKGWNHESSPYAALIAYFGKQQANDKNDAEQFLRESLSKLNTASWAYNIFRYLKGEFSAEQLLAKADNNNKQTEAHAYIGIALSLKEKFEEAFTHLSWVKDKGNKKLIEYGIALSEIKQITEKSQVLSLKSQVRTERPETWGLRLCFKELNLKSFS